MELSKRSYPVSYLEIGLVGFSLALASSFAPLALYVLALMLFGLPHVLWEFNWVRQTYSKQIPPLIGWTWGAILSIQALARLGVWAGWLSSDFSIMIDLLSLFCLLLSVSALLYHQDRQKHFIALMVLGLGGLALIWAIQTQNIVMVLVILAVAHNFTPLWLVNKNQTFDDLATRPILISLFSLPLLVFVLVVWMQLNNHDSSLWMPSEAKWLKNHLPAAANALLSAIILAQCLHYYAVLRLMPSTLSATQQELGTQHFLNKWRWWAVAVSLLLSIYFLQDFDQARQLYAVASGIHAWLEWPLIALLFTQSSASSSQSKHG